MIESHSLDKSLDKSILKSGNTVHGLDEMQSKLEDCLYDLDKNIVKVG